MGKTRNRSEIIRSYLAEHPNAKPTEVAEALGQQGVNVTPALASFVIRDVRRRIDSGRPAPAAREAGVAKPTGKKKKKKAVQKNLPTSKKGTKSKSNKAVSATNGVLDDVMQDLNLANQFIKDAGGIERATRIMELAATVLKN